MTSLVASKSRLKMGLNSARQQLRTLALLHVRQLNCPKGVQLKSTNAGIIVLDASSYLQAYPDPSEVIKTDSIVQHNTTPHHTR